MIRFQLSNIGTRKDEARHGAWTKRMAILERSRPAALSMLAAATVDAPDGPDLVLIPLPPPEGVSIPTIDFQEFYVFGPRAPRCTAKLLGLSGKRVTLVGYMVQMELPPRGGFYLAPYPAACDESGAGRGGLPPSSAFILPPTARGKEVAFVPGALEVTGTLDVGNRPTDDGEVTTIRLVLDHRNGIRFARRPAPARGTIPSGKEKS